jgi:hypothetical protein
VKRIIQVHAFIDRDIYTSDVTAFYEWIHNHTTPHRPYPYSFFIEVHSLEYDLSARHTIHIDHEHDNNCTLDIIYYNDASLIEENGFLFKEREIDGLIFYDSLEVLDDPDKTLDIIKDSDQYWATCSGAPSLTPIIGLVDTESNTDYLNDLSVFRPTEHEYWNDWLLDEPTRRILTQATIDNCHQYNINTSDLAEIMSPLKPRMTQPSEIDYESKRKYFAYLPASVVKATFKHTTQNMPLPPSTYLRKMFKSPNPSANLKRRDVANSTDQIFPDTPAIIGGEKSAHLSVGKKSKLTDAYKSKDSSSAEFLKCLQDRV